MNSSTKCATPDRNYCAPNGKVAALFVDIDGTTVVCQPNFDESAESFAWFMKLRGFNPTEARALMHEIDLSKTEQEGFEVDRYGRSLIDCYHKLVADKKRRFTVEQRTNDERILRSIGMAPFFRPPVDFPNAGPVLSRARKSFRILAMSIGNREAQKFKVRQAGLDSVFDDLLITPRDNKVEIMREVIEDLNIDPRHSAHIGNSMRSDGAALAITNFIYLPLESGWSFDKSKPIPVEKGKDSGFEMFTVRDWREAEERGINRLLRRRKSIDMSAEERRCGHKKSNQ